jgi:hypothetical protein
MHDQRNDACVAEPEVRDDSTVLNLLLDPTLRAPLSVHEVTREVGEHVKALDAIARLHGSGLIHRFDEFVFATLAARRSRELG